MRKFEYVLATFAVLLVLVACLASCRFGGAKVGAEVPPYGNATIEIEEGELDMPDLRNAEDAVRGQDP